MFTTVLATFGLGTALISTGQDMVYQFKNVPARPAFEQIATMYDVQLGKGTSFEAKGNRISVDLERNRVTWSKADDDLTDLCELFDVKPMPVQVSLVVYSPFYERTWTSEATVYNNRPFEFSDEMYGISFLLTPKVNADSTVTITAKVYGTKVLRFGGNQFTDLGPLGNTMTWRQISDPQRDMEKRKSEFLKFYENTLGERQPAVTDLYYYVAVHVAE